MPRLYAIDSLTLRCQWNHLVVILCFLFLCCCCCHGFSLVVVIPSSRTNNNDNKNIHALTNRHTNECLYSFKEFSQEGDDSDSNFSDDDDAPPQWYKAQLFDDDDEDGIFQGYEDERGEEWLSDAEKARRRRQLAKAYHTNANNINNNNNNNNSDGVETQVKSSYTTTNAASAPTTTTPTARSFYTDEEEELILAMGGKTSSDSTSLTPTAANRREPGYLGDCTLQEIATDYSVPICYLADVLCTWGVAVPIHIKDRLGDLVTGEQAFSLLEAIHTLDIAVLQDRYSNQNMIQVCDDYNVNIRDAFQMAMREGWSLPFGVQTHLRTEQEDELVRVLGGSYYTATNTDIDDDYDE